MEFAEVPVSIDGNIKLFNFEICADGNREYYRITNGYYSLKVFESLVAVSGNMPDHWLIPVVRKLEQILEGKKSFVKKEIQMEEPL